MKKLSRFLTVVAIVFATSLIVTSCDNHAELAMNSQDSVEYNSNTAKTLKDYNDSLNFISGTRGKKQDKWIEVAVEDAKGAAAGITIGGFVGRFLGPHACIISAVACGVVLGGASSYVACNSYEHSLGIRKMPVLTQNASYDIFCAAYAQSKNDIDVSDYRINLLHNMDSCSVSIGILHNKVLDVVNNVDQDSYQIRYNLNLSDEEKQILASTEFIKEFNELMNSGKVNLDLLTVETKEILTLFSEAVSKNVSSNEDLSSIIGYYSVVVNNSNDLTLDDKKCLCGAFSVMNYSYEYWSEFFGSSDISYPLN